MTPNQLDRLAEKAIVRAAVRGLIKRGYHVSLFDGEETAIKPTQDIEAIMAEVQACDEEWLRAHVPVAGHPGKWGTAGSIYLIYGNSPWEVIADNHVNLNPMLEDADALADKLEKLLGGHHCGATLQLYCEHEHPLATREAWRQAVANDDTVNGYWDWAAHCLTERLPEAVQQLIEEHFREQT